MSRPIFRHAVLVDTSVLYALVDPSDQNHRAARAQHERLKAEALRTLVTYPTLQEAHVLVLHRLKPHVARGWLREVTAGADLLGVPASDFQKAIALAERYHDQVLTLHDLLLSVVAQTLNLPIWTFDADFDILGAQVWRPA